MVDQLVDRNLVFRRVDPVDRRRIRAYLTARGRAEHGRVDALVRADLAGLLIGDDDTLAQRLEDLIDGLDPARRRMPARTI
ncbi:hypothetical protein [Micromonospora zamorensis]|uniref:hypothetical protein n=1 Tax=Micromonospora zamorensis TaxID=709883 RepID=UPI0018D56839|nr:hypothetical protein [Micromonospora zamorensis]